LGQKAIQSQIYDWIFPVELQPYPMDNSDNTATGSADGVRLGCFRNHSALCAATDLIPIEQ
jgi:hypothetical protein